MSRIVSEDGVVVETWDDASRTWTDHRTDPATVLTYAEKSLADGLPQTTYDDQATVDAAQALRASNEEGLLGEIQTVIDQINARIGSGSYVATGITDPQATLVSLTLMSNAALATDFQANVGRWLKYLMRVDKQEANQIIRLLRLVGDRVDSASLGDQT